MAKPQKRLDWGYDQMNDCPDAVSNFNSTVSESDGWVFQFVYIVELVFHVVYRCLLRMLVFWLVLIIIVIPFFHGDLQDLHFHHCTDCTWLRFTRSRRGFSALARQRCWCACGGGRWVGCFVSGSCWSTGIKIPPINRLTLNNPWIIG